MDTVPFAFIETVTNNFSSCSREFNKFAGLAAPWSSIAKIRLTKQKFNVSFYLTEEGPFFDCGKLDLSTFDPHLHDVDDIQISCHSRKTPKELNEAAAKAMVAIFSRQQGRFDWVVISSFDKCVQRYPLILKIMNAIHGCKVLEINGKVSHSLDLVENTQELRCSNILPQVLETNVLNIVTSENSVRIFCDISARNHVFIKQLVKAMNGQAANEQFQLVLNREQTLDYKHEWSNGYIRHSYGSFHFSKTF
ncbi:hypothetical protein L596_010790 [Steinernema carpocapsae]|uniref:Uncharacterized protein n=1 Tax=Steinernema carpocapsae TaxID=34508 RepID=A0A4U5PJK8_STECR|nr:hypothetical protein L596_010790 [Steinernema carpocapsae]